MIETYQKIIKGLLIAGIVFGLLGLILKYGVFFGLNANDTQRSNEDCTVTQRIFDRADKLSDGEEEKLSKLIAKREQQTGLDIVLVTIDDDSVNDYYAIRDYAQQYYEEYQFGWDQANGDGIIYVDDWATGYSWLCTTGKAADKLDQDTIDFIVEKTNKRVNDNPYAAYKTMINTAALEMQNLNLIHLDIGALWIFLIAIAAAVIFAAVQLMGHGGRDTTGRDTYVSKGGVKMNDRRDMFMHSHVTRRKIEKHDGGGHGGGGSGSMGGSGGHGGGGGRH